MIATALTSIYLYFAVKLTKDVTTPVFNKHVFYSDLKTKEMQWIISAIFTVMIILMSVSLMCKLRLRFEDFYKEYGCFLWLIFNIQALSMTI